MWRGTCVLQFWGDLDRHAAATAGLQVWPPDEPTHGHMGILPSHVGPDPVVRLQTGSLKAAQSVRSPCASDGRPDPDFAQFFS
jgi:hypothetical protein